MNQNIDEAVGKAFEKYLNGQFRELRHEFREHKQKAELHWENNRKFQEEIRPLLDALQFVQTFQRFLKWGGITIAAFIGVLYWLIRRS